MSAVASQIATTAGTAERSDVERDTASANAAVAAMKLELRYTDATPLTWLPRYTVYAFYDAGFVRRRTPVNEPGPRSAATTVPARGGPILGTAAMLSAARPGRRSAPCGRLPPAGQIGRAHV